MGLHAGLKTERSVHPMTPSPQGTKGRVLFMDDEADIRRVGTLVLRHLGFDAVAVADGPTAIETFRAAHGTAEAFVAVILDLTIPGGMGGVDTLQQLRGIDPGIGSIVSSGYSNDDVMADFSAYGFDAIVSKPYEIAAMARALDQILARRKTSAPD